MEIIQEVENNIKNNKFPKLSKKKSKIAREYFQKQVKIPIAKSGGEKIPLFLGDKIFSSDYERVVIGDYGAYVEIKEQDIICKLYVKF